MMSRCLSGGTLLKVINNIGRYKTWVSRLQTYTGPLNFIMILYLYVVNEPLGLKWYVWFILLIGALIVVLFLDIAFIYPSEQQYNTRKNPEWNELRADVQRIMDKLGIK